MKLGEHFRALREDRGLSIEQLSAETRISAKVLRAIESDDPKLLPAQAITRGFLINALRILGHDANAFLVEHSAEMAALGGMREGAKSHFEGYAFEQQELDQNRRWMTVSAVVGAVFVLGALFILKPKLKKRGHAPEELSAENKAKVVQPDLEQAFTQEAVPSSAGAAKPTITPTRAAPTPSPVAVAVAIATPPQPTPTKASPTPVAAVPIPSPAIAVIADASPSVSPSPSPTPKPDPLFKGDDLQPKAIAIKIAFKALQDTYVQYQSDERKPLTMVFRAGKLLVIKAERQIRFRVQNNQAVEMKVRSGAFEPLTISNFKIDKSGTPEAQSGGILGLKELGTEPPNPKP